MPHDSAAALPTFHQAAEWIGRVYAGDPVRRALNRGLAWVLVAVALLALGMTGVLATIGRPPQVWAVAAAVGPACLACWWFNRRGGRWGAIGFAATMVLGTALGVEPSLYAGPVPMVDMAFMYSVVAAALFVRPLAGLVALAAQLAALALALAHSEVPAAQALAFLVEAALEMGAMAALVIVAARIFIQALEDTRARADALARSEQRSRRLLDTNIVGIVVADADGRVLQANDAFLSMAGQTRDTLQAGQLQTPLFRRPPHGNGNGQAAYETALARADGSTLPVLVGEAPLGGGDEHVAFVLDLTEHHSLQAERSARSAAEAANRAKTTFLANMSHELRTPLNAILGFSQLMLADPSAPERQRKRADLIHQSGTHLLSLVEDVLDFARIEVQRLELMAAPTGLAPLLEAAAAAAEQRARDKGIGLRFEPQPGLPDTVVADAKRLRQVLHNLLDNAVKFTDSGHVSLRVRRGAHADPAAARLLFEVEDTGVGLSADELQRVFEPFEQGRGGLRQQSGAGLGLSISRQLVRLMGGELRVQSTPGRGSRFSFELVLPAQAAPPPPHQPRLPSGYDGPRRTVLLADDVALNRVLLRDALSAVGLQVREASDGVQAVAAARELRPDIVLIDSVMPELDGVQAIAQMRATPGLQALPIISISASASASDRQRSLDAGASAFLAKPVDLRELLGLMGALLGLAWRHDAVAPLETPEAP